MTNNLLTAFQKSMVDLCKTKQASITLPESSDPRVLEATQNLLEKGCAKEVILLDSNGDLENIIKTNNYKIDLNDSRVITPQRDIADYMTKTKLCYSKYLEKKGRQVSEEALQKWAESPLNQAAAILDAGISDSALAGCVYNTSDVIRAALQGVGLREGNKTISGSFAMTRTQNDIETRYMYGDCGVVIDPSADQLVDIATETVETFKQLFPELEPKVAFLSFSTKGSAKHAMAGKMIEAHEKFSKRHPTIKADGELQFDAAIVPSVASRKCPDSPIEGDANCFIFPNLDAGNLVYKVSQRLAGFEAYGPILQGTKKPYSDLSRGASADDIFTSALITMLRA